MLCFLESFHHEGGKKSKNIAFKTSTLFSNFYLAAMQEGKLSLWILTALKGQKRLPLH